MPRKHLWLSIPSVSLDMLRVCWESRTVNQTIIAWCPGEKAKSQKVQEKGKLCCNSPPVKYHPHCFLHVSVTSDTLLSETRFYVYLLAHIYIICIPSHSLCWSHSLVLHHCFSKELPLTRVVTLHWCKAGGDNAVQIPCRHLWAVTDCAAVSRLPCIQLDLIRFFLFRHGLLAQECPLMCSRPGFRKCQIQSKPLTCLLPSYRINH